MSAGKTIEEPLDELVQGFWKIEAEGTLPEQNEDSSLDQLAVQTMENSICHNGERYQIGLSWKPAKKLRNNFFSEVSQLKSLQKRLQNEPGLSQKYNQTLQTDLDKNFVKPVEMQAPPPESIWYLPHHPVTNPNKPGNVRRVANAASKFRGESLNSNLLTGPDLLNNLVGVLLRFREHPVAVFSDIEGMFMQIAVTQEDQSALRFLWMIDNSIRQFQFTRLIFGATCSPFCAIYVLNKCAEDKKSKFPAALNAIKHHFYMGDYIQSLPTISEAKEVISQTRCLKNGGFRLTKFSNEPDVLAEISSDDKDETKEIIGVPGQKWNITTDDFLMFPLQQFPKDATLYTQRKIFSLVSSIFDPFGLLSPLAIIIKMVLQQIWKLGRKWDDLIPQELHNALQKILNSYFAMPEIRIPRTVGNFSKTTSSQLHMFVDASMAAMAAVAYLRTTNSQATLPQVCFLMGKCNFAPIKQMSVPKMELEAAVIEVRLLQLIQREMTMTIDQNFL